MEGILKDILEAEEQARKMAEETEKFKEKKTAEIELECKNLIDKKMEEAKKEALRLKEEHRKKTLSLESVIDGKEKAALENLSNIEKQNRKSWVDALYKRTLGL